MGSEKFCLRWNDFETNISNALRDIRDDKDFFDVSLVCDDEQILAHKVVLSACSPFFKNILRRNPHQHPVLYLRGVRFTDIQFVLNFMYHGEVSVAQDELNTFLSVAEDLMVKGLTQNQTQSQSLNPRPSKVKLKEGQGPPEAAQSYQRFEKPAAAAPPSNFTKPTTKPTSSVSHHNNSVATIDTMDEDDIQEVVPVKSEPRDREFPIKTMVTTAAPAQLYSNNTENCQTLATADEYYQDQSYEDYCEYGDQDQGYDGQGGAHPEESEGHREQLEACILKVEENGSLFYKCSLCGKTTTRKDALKTHVENIHFPGSYQCYHCDQVFNSKITRNVHVGRKHKY